MDGSFYYYLILSCICSVIFYSLYIIFPVRKNILLFNRMYLLFTILFSITLPIVNLTGLFPFNEPPVNISSAVNSAVNVPVLIKLTPENTIITEQPGIFYYIGIIYLAVVFFLVLKIFVSIGKVFILYKRGVVVKNGNHTIVLTDKNFVPFSFGKIIFINKEKATNHLNDQIIIHESVHANQLHTIDIVIAELFTAFQWFNPAAWLIKRSFAELHEFIADKEVIDKGYDAESYSKLLINYSAGFKPAGFSNSFSGVFLKKRIIMMNKHKPGRFVILMNTFVLLFAVLLAFTFTMGRCGNNIPELINEYNFSEEYSRQPADINKVPEIYASLVWNSIASYANFDKRVQKELYPGLNICMTLKYDWQKGTLSNLNVFKIMESEADKNQLLKEIKLKEIDHLREMFPNMISKVTKQETLKKNLPPSVFVKSGIIEVNKMHSIK